MPGTFSEIYSYTVAEGGKLLRALVHLYNNIPRLQNNLVGRFELNHSTMALNEIRGRLALITGASGG